MTTLLYGRPPVVFDPPGTGAGGAIQTSPLIPGSTALETVPEGSVDDVMIYAPPGVLERRYALALALRALKVGGRLDVMALKDKGGSRLKKELTGFGVEVGETAKAHHRRCIVIKPETLTGIDEAIAEGAPRIVPGLEAWSQPGVFAWDRIDAGSALLAQHMPALKGAGVDLGCGYGALATVALRSAAVTSLRLIDLDRRAVEAARKNVEDPRVSIEWADVRTMTADGELNFVVSNPPFHDGGAEDRRLGQAFIRKAAELLKKGGVAWIVANRHLPYEAELNTAFNRVRLVADAGGYKLFEAVK
ncbi:MAG: methyltransferase [Brevundimonas sp. 32-68-21]|jgi:16S rRNA (guanine1207-N2)-methyltransferase|uniref:Class I SAM-dependent methyltransferase n=1 Tax=Brevundimonas mediterranea TaxID=74329 RepID=A0AB37E6I6_9CAUL|nr:MULTISPECIES: class I SAM-dependent methyltransferase [Brevundimonas]OYX79298.1 MAG: methyltransferase [Brevundimonas sp. 32-68-21]EDX79133.1 Methyltransferase small domain family [Brevundimonas sp. BAL3]MBA4332363.1 class I SAM-dependent methyltransferase [Brevundimonas sp.]QIH72518.1 class I SAM-dependent methyltransferase [Brevundimonas mediterranea]TAJ41838.1 MAG: class I SAM-dependent methyltransferase [Brevundimonas sp.]